MRCLGTISRGVRLPIVKEGDNLRKIVVDAIINASKETPFNLNNKDVVCVTESIVGRCEGNYASIDDIKDDIIEKFGENATIGVVFPILSRNRFSILLAGLARASKKIILMLSYPSDEVGNHLISLDLVDEKGINPYSDVLSLDKYRELFGYKSHEFTGVDYVDFYRNLIIAEGCEVEVVFANQVKTILEYTNNVVCADIHTRFRNKRILKSLNANVYGLDDILTKSINGSGYNSIYGLLGSNKATEDTVKLFPKEGKELVEGIQKDILDSTGVKVEVMVYGDGAFKDPQGKIWELADPVVSPFYTDGLEGTPNELKLKYLADNDFKDLKGESLKEAIKEKIKEKDSNLVGKMISEGTTPRKITDLLGSLADLTSGSGDKGTPVVLIQGYFDNYTNE